MQKTDIKYKILVIIILISSLYLTCYEFLRLFDFSFFSSIEQLKSEVEFDKSNTWFLYQYIASELCGKLSKIFAITILVTAIVSLFKKNQVLPTMIMSQGVFLTLLSVYSKYLTGKCNLYIYFVLLTLLVIGLVVISVLKKQILLILLGIESLLLVVKFIYNLIKYINSITEIGIIYMNLEYGLNALVMICGLILGTMLYKNKLQNRK